MVAASATSNATPLPVSAAAVPASVPGSASPPTLAGALQSWQVRMAGLLYLVLIVLGAVGELAIRGSLTVDGDVAATAHNIVASEGLWRMGVAGDLLMQVLDLPVMVVMYLLLRPVHHGLALFATLINLVQTAVLAANKLTMVLPLLLLGGSPTLAAFSTEQLQAFAYLAIRMHGYGFAIGLIFFGAACMARGWLIYRSGFMPKVIGCLMALAGVCYLVNSVALLVAPAVAGMLFPFVMLPPVVGETLFAGWLLVTGARNRPRF